MSSTHVAGHTRTVLSSKNWGGGGGRRFGRVKVITSLHCVILAVDPGIFLLILMKFYGK